MQRLRYVLGFLILTSLGLGTEPVSAGNPADFTSVLKQHAARYPEAEVQDYYKLLVQACLGSEHAVADRATAQRWLDRELAALPAGPAEPLIDPISPDGRLVRVHLRPFAAQQGDPAKLVDAFVQTANTFHGSRETLAAAWAQVVALAGSGALPFSAETAREFGRTMAAADWPAVRHSARFNERYHPAYRVVAREHLTGWLLPTEP